MGKAEEVLAKAKLKSSYWGRKIIQAERGGGFSTRSGYLASSWVTCACGKLDDGIPRFVDDAPGDPKLRRLGHLFYIRVCRNDCLSAAEALVKIEQRAKQVLMEVNRNGV